MSAPELQAAFLIGRWYPQPSCDGVCVLTLILYYCVEKDVNNEVLWVWSYPGVDGGLRDLLMRKCTLDQEGAVPYSYGHFHGNWYYLNNFSTDNSDQLPKVTLSIQKLLERGR